MGRVLTDAVLTAWARRLDGREGASTSASSRDAPTVPDWLASQVIRLDGHVGMTQLSNFGTMSADDPSAFEAALLRRPIGATMLYSTLQTPHTVSYDRPMSDGEDIVIVGLAGHGGQRLRSAGGTEMMGVGRMGFMSSLGFSAVEHLGISDTTGVVVPVAAVPGYRRVLERGAATFPDSPLTRTAGASLARMLCEWVKDPEQGPGTLAGTEAALIALVRALLRQFPADGRVDRASELRAEAMRVIERRHRDPGFGIEELAAALHVSRRQLFRLFSGSDSSLASRLLHRRLATAREELLTLPPQDLSAVASRSGFGDATALRAQFSRHMGLSPSAFRVQALSRPAPLAEAMLLTDEQSGRTE